MGLPLKYEGFWNTSPVAFTHIILRLKSARVVDAVNSKLGMSGTAMSELGTLAGIGSMLPGKPNGVTA